MSTNRPSIGSMIHEIAKWIFKKAPLNLKMFPGAYTTTPMWRFLYIQVSFYTEAKGSKMWGTDSYTTGSIPVTWSLMTLFKPFASLHLIPMKLNTALSAVRGIKTNKAMIMHLGSTCFECYAQSKTPPSIWLSSITNLILQQAIWEVFECNYYYWSFSDLNDLKYHILM